MPRMGARQTAASPVAAEKLLLAAVIALLGAAAWALEARGGGEVPLARYVTSLRNRTAAQRLNAILAAGRLDRTTIPSGGTFSFNRAVGPWTADRGYVRAPVSYDGELLPAWGGGVCQTSTTLYNAALLAGLEVVERHPHAWPPRYIAPGRDAAVAYPLVDLVLRNPHPWPVRLVARANGDVLAISVLGGRRLACSIAVTAEVHSVVPPGVIRQTSDQGPHAAGPASRRVLNWGRSGFEAAVVRVYRQAGRPERRELVSADSYPAMNRVVRAADEQ